MDIGSIYILIGVRILRLGAWSGSGSGSGSNLFTYTEIGVWNHNQNLIYMFTLSWMMSKWFQIIILTLFKNYSF